MLGRQLLQDIFEQCAQISLRTWEVMWEWHSAGYVGGTFDSDNAYSEFVTRPQIYSPTAAQGQRWSKPLTDSGIDRGYHNSALLIASGEVCHIVKHRIEQA